MFRPDRQFFRNARMREDFSDFTQNLGALLEVIFEWGGQTAEEWKGKRPVRAPSLWICSVFV